MPLLPSTLRAIARSLACLGLAWAVPSVALAALPSPQPWMLRSFGNGHGLAVFDHAAGKLTDWWVRPYQAFAPGQPTRDVLFDAYFGLQVPGQGGKWATSLPLTFADGKSWTAAQGADDAVFGYLGTAGIVRERRQWTGTAPLQVETFAFAPQTCGDRCLALIGKVVNGGDTPAVVTVALLPNLHLGSGSPQPGSDGEALSTLTSGLLETGPDQQDLTLPMAGSTAKACTNNPYAALSGSGLTCDTTALPAGQDRAGSLQWQVTVPAKGSTVVGAVLGYAEKGTAVPGVADWLGPRTAQEVLADEQTWWQQWHAADLLPAQLTATQLQHAQRALTLLKMAQARQGNLGPTGQGQSPYGQIVASLPPGIWNITWPRDQSYAAVALARSGHVAEARDAADFVLHGAPGKFVAEVGAPYRVSATRYWGGGQEESDTNQDGPNIELDGFGLVLWQIGHYMTTSQDFAWLTARWPVIRDEIAAPLLQAVDGTGLVKADSSIWEVHWNGKQKHFAYTSLQAVRGLCAAAKLATLAGEGKLAAQYRLAAQGIRGAVIKQLVDKSGILVGNAEEPAGKNLDLAAVEALTDGQLPPWGEVAQKSWQAWQNLAAGGGPGFFRNDDGGEYDSQEWLFIDLRVLRWLDRAIAAGAPLADVRQALSDRVDAIATAGGGQLPELIGVAGAQAGQFAGAIPMMGFGAGASLLTWLGEAAGDDLQGCLQAASGDAEADASAEPATELEPEPGPEPAPEATPEPALEPAPEPGPELQSDTVSDLGAQPSSDALSDLQVRADAALPDAPTAAARGGPSGSSCHAGRAAGSPWALAALALAGILCRARRRNA